MGMLKSISLENYKSFRKLSDFGISPLTVICGINSSGKSSLFKSLLLLKQSYESLSGYNGFALNGAYTNNGFYKDIALEKTKSICFRNTFRITKSSDRALSPHERMALKEINNNYGGSVNEKGLSLSVSYEIKSKKNKKSAVVDNELVTLTIEVSGDKSLYSIIKIQLGKGNKYEITIKGLPDYDVISLHSVSCYFEGLRISNLFYKSVEPATASDCALSWIYTISRIVASQYKDIFYISPLRVSPARSYVIDHDVNCVGIHGESVSQIIEKFSTRDSYLCLPPKDDQFDYKSGIVKMETIKCINEWLKYFGIEPLLLDTFNDFARILVGKQNIADVGFGISQVLPIVVAIVTLPKQSTLLIEQPEVHLHPRMQMALADLFVAAALSGKNVVVETHSEHMINRISRRMMEDAFIMDHST